MNKYIASMFLLIIAGFHGETIPHDLNYELKTIPDDVDPPKPKDQLTIYTYPILATSFITFECEHVIKYHYREVAIKRKEDSCLISWEKLAKTAYFQKDESNVQNNIRTVVIWNGDVIGVSHGGVYGIRNGVSVKYSKDFKQWYDLFVLPLHGVVDFNAYNSLK